MKSIALFGDALEEGVAILGVIDRAHLQSLDARLDD